MATANPYAGVPYDQLGSVPPPLGPGGVPDYRPLQAEMLRRQKAGQTGSSPASTSQVIRPGGVTTDDVRNLSFADLLKKEHGIDINAPKQQTLIPQEPVAPQPPPPTQSLFTAPQPTMPDLSAVLPQAPNLLNPSPAPPPSQTFLADAKVNPGTAAPAPVPVVPGPSGGLILAQDYAPAPPMPGYAMARTGSPFQAPQAGQAAHQAPPSLWDALGQPLPASSYSLWY